MSEMPKQFEENIDMEVSSSNSSKGDSSPNDYVPLSQSSSTISSSGSSTLDKTIDVLYGTKAIVFVQLLLNLFKIGNFQGVTKVVLNLLKLFTLDLALQLLWNVSVVISTLCVHN